MKRYEDAVLFHGHSCPGLALGYRVALRALKEFKSRSADEEIIAFVENNSCAVDAVQVMTGCTFGKGNLIFRDYGKQVYIFSRRPSGKSIRIAVKWEKPPETEHEKRLWNAYAKGDRSKKVVEFVHSMKNKKVAAILSASDDELFDIRKMKIVLPHEAEIYRSIACESCRERTAEPGIRLKDGRMFCIPCFERKTGK